METAFEVIMQLSEQQLACVYGDLKNHCLMYKNICLYDGTFHDNGLVDFSNIAALIPYQHVYTQPQWENLMRAGYMSYVSAYPKRCRHLNFLPADKDSFDWFYTADDFHHARVTLDLLILFAYHGELFAWDNPKHFMTRVCDGCVVLRDWVVKS